MAQTKEEVAHLLKKYLPEDFIGEVVALLFQENISFKITPPRKTKHGDYRPPHRGKPHQITVNGDLNKYAFLITTIHEFAHQATFLKYGRKVKAHGEEWKNEFRRLLLPILEKRKLPKDIEVALVRSFNNVKASSCTDVQLYRVLKQYDERKDSHFLLEELPDNAYFRLNGKIFCRGKLRRSRFLCTDIQTERQYTISRLAEVERIIKKP